MPPKKPAKPNGFVIFAQELQKQHGRKYSSLKEACDGAAPLWARMSKDQRKPYDDKARELKGQMHPTRYTSEGIDVEVLTREEQMKNQMEEKMRQDIRSMISTAHKNDALESQVFFVIHCNIFCYYPNDDRYYPAEISVLSFTLKDGAKPENVFHFMVHPGCLPVGYKFEAKQHSDETHLLKVPFDDYEENNQEEVYFSLKAFLEKKKPAGIKRMPILFADKKIIKVVQRILDAWSEDYDTETNLFKVYNLQIMFFFLRNIVAGDQVWTSTTFSDRELEKDVYAYVTEIACPFHASCPQPLFCSKSIVLRYAYVICDNCCSDLGIEYIEGQHVPLYSTIPDSVSTFGSSTSSRSSQSGRSSRRGFHNDFETESDTDTFDTQSLASVSSQSTLISNLDDHFPSLGKSRSQSQASNYLDSTPNNSSSVKSYAGATTKSSLPHAFEKRMSDLSLNSNSIVRGRGIRRRANDESDSDASAVSGASARSFASTLGSDVLTKGRGIRKVRAPGSQNGE